MIANNENVPESVSKAYQTKVTTWNSYHCARRRLLAACDAANVGPLTTARLLGQWTDKQPAGVRRAIARLK